MDLKQLEYLVSVVEKGSFSRAAVHLNLAQPSVSRQIALLEQELGQRLLERTGRGVRPTEAGEALLVHARVMLNAAAQARLQVRDLSAQPTGKVVIGLPHRVASGLAVPLIHRFRERFPLAMISLVEGLSLSLREGLIAGRIDLCLLFDPEPTPLLAYETVMRERLVLVYPRHFKLAEQVDVGKLGEFPMVLPSAPNPIRNLVDAVLLPRQVRLNVVAEVVAVHTALSLVADGSVCSILPESAVHWELPQEAVKVARIGPPEMWTSLVLAVPKSRPISRLIQQSSQLLRELDFRA
jgi:LysR family nitrogen assimilation transcriptional regulator